MHTPSTRVASIEAPCALKPMMDPGLHAELGAGGIPRARRAWLMARLSIAALAALAACSTGRGTGGVGRAGAGGFSLDAAGSGGVTGSGGAPNTGGALAGAGGRDAGAGVGGAAITDAGAEAIADAGGAAGDAGTSTTPTIVESVDITTVWSGDPLMFALVTRGTQQFAAFYDANQNMTVASRTLGSTIWKLQRLPSVVGWDSHNYVAMAIDESNQIHVSGNMHGVPLIYFRTKTALDITSFATLDTMVGTNEQSVTYPVFFNGPAGNLIYEYRDGVSGAGNTIFDSYSASNQTWTRLLDSPLLDGEGLRNAYPEGPVLGPDGYFHLVWVWRETPDASTNHDLSYARSRDLVHWEAGNGRALTLPVTLENADIVDPVPMNGGMINNNTRVGFDAQNRPMIAYHKFDAAGNTQLYEARLETGKWVVHQATDWTYRWVIGGSGSLVFQVEIDNGAQVLANGRLVQDFYHALYGGQGTLLLDPTTLHSQQTITPPLTPYPIALAQAQSPRPGWPCAGRSIQAPARIPRSSTCCAGRPSAPITTCHARPSRPPPS